MAKGPIINMRYESLTQVNRFKRLAKAHRWSLNDFMLEAGERLATQLEEEVDSRKSSSNGQSEGVVTRSSV